jgi:hypothetical protein
MNSEAIFFIVNEQNGRSPTVMFNVFSRIASLFANTTHHYILSTKDNPGFDAKHTHRQRIESIFETNPLSVSVSFHL